jgi:hypothetical protein
VDGDVLAQVTGCVDLHRLGHFAARQPSFLPAGVASVAGDPGVPGVRAGERGERGVHEVDLDQSELA